MPERRLPGRPLKSSELLRHADAIFAGFAIHAGQKPRYRVGGIAAGMNVIGATNAREVWRYYTEVEADIVGAQIIEESGWAKEFAFPWDSNLNYPTFLRAFQGHPILFYKAVQFIATFEAYALCKGGGDIYAVMDIIPCSYNLDRFKSSLLAELRAGALGIEPRDFYYGTVQATGQTNPELLDRMAQGECVTKETAERLQSYLLSILSKANRPESMLGSVRPHPGKKKLGKKPASELEYVDTDSPKPSYVDDQPTHQPRR